MKCPACGSQRFFVKDPEDEYDTHEFDLEAGQPVFANEPQEVQPETETYCCGAPGMRHLKDYSSKDLAIAESNSAL